MRIRNNQELRMFESVIDRCRRTVWLVTPEGEQFDLKTPSGRYQGIAKMLSAGEYEESELFASCLEDEMTIFEFFAWREQVA